MQNSAQPKPETADTPETADKVYQYRPKRWDVIAEIKVDDGCGRELDARLGNISKEGFMCECEERLPVGEIVIVDLPGRGEVRAEIRWAVGWRFGALILED